MRPLIRSLFLLSLSAAPLALAATPAKAVPQSTEVSDTTSVEPAPGDVTRVRTQVRDLEATLNDVRREVALLREQEAAIRTRGISEPVDHFNWGQF
ncbi:MAG: hypothetical protein ACXWK8_06120 [Myxococcaceae bacterium]